MINQTTMLASETLAISNYLKVVMKKKYGVEDLKKHMANTRDTLCYATNENQDSTYRLLDVDADLAIVVGGYNSSNTSHLVELCEKKLPTYFISNASEVLNESEILHFDFENKKILQTKNFLPKKEVVDILLTSGASCPDTIVENVLNKLLRFYPTSKSTEEVLETL